MARTRDGRGVRRVHGRSRARGSATASGTGSRTTSRGSHAWIGHAWGEHAPGRTSEADAVAAAHHLLLSHGWAVEVIRCRRSRRRRSASRSTSRTRIRLPTRPRTRRRRGRSTARGTAGSSTRSSGAPIPPICSSATSWSRPSSSDGDLETISAPLDFLGVNNYFRFVVSAGADGPRMERDPESQHTDMGWEVYPDGLHRLLVRVAATTRRRRST